MKPRDVFLGFFDSTVVRLPAPSKFHSALYVRKIYIIAVFKIPGKVPVQILYGFELGPLPILKTVINSHFPRY